MPETGRAGMKGWLAALAQQPANNAGVSNLVVALAALLLVAASLAVPSKAVFLPLGAALGASALGLVYAIVTARPLSLDARLVGRRLAGARKPDVLRTMLVKLGVVGGVAAYAYLALTSSGLQMTRYDFNTSFLNLALTQADGSSGKDEVLRWGLYDKRPLFFAYLLIVAFAVYYRLTLWLVEQLTRPAQATAPVSSVPSRVGLRSTSAQRLLRRLGGAALIAVLAFAWIGVPTLRAVTPSIGDGLALFHNIHNYVHLSGLEQIRQGALPFVEAKTQYGLGNQTLLYLATNAIHFSLHGFYAACVLIDIACVLLFFVCVQQLLGLRWALLCLLGWLVLPSPLDFLPGMAAGALQTRWVAVAILSLALANLLLGRHPNRRRLLGALACGLLWGVGGFLSQENLSGGLLVLALSLALFAPAAGLRLGEIVRFAGLFLASGLLADLILTASVVGIGHVATTFALAAQKPGLVVAGVSDSWWSDPLGLTLGFNALNGIFDGLFRTHGAFGPLLETYGDAIVLVVTLVLLARLMSRHFAELDAQTRDFVAKFGGVTVGAYVLLSFGLLRSDAGHLASPALLMPLFIPMLVVFAWRCLGRGPARRALMAYPLAVVVLSTLPQIPRIPQIADATTPAALWRDGTRAVAAYRDLRQARQDPDDLANRYSPLPAYQAQLRRHPDFPATREMFDRLRAALQGRRVELSFYRVNRLIESPELFYFLGGFRSITGITSPMTTLWLRSEEDAWIRSVAAANTGCLFLDVDPKGYLVAAWRKSLGPGQSLAELPIAGTRDYGSLSCKTR